MHLFAQVRHPLHLPENPQGDEIRHSQGAAHRRMARPRQGPRDGMEEVGQDGMVSEAMHEVLETIEQGWLPYLTVFQYKMRARRDPLVKSFFAPVKKMGRSGGGCSRPVGGWKNRLISFRRCLGTTKALGRDIFGAAGWGEPDTVVWLYR